MQLKGTLLFHVATPCPACFFPWVKWNTHMPWAQQQRAFPWGIVLLIVFFYFYSASASLSRKTVLPFTLFSPGVLSLLPIPARRPLNQPDPAWVASVSPRPAGAWPQRVLPLPRFLCAQIIKYIKTIFLLCVWRHNHYFWLVFRANKISLLRLIKPCRLSILWVFKITSNVNLAMNLS